jgi:hypothetical protein
MGDCNAKNCMQSPMNLVPNRFILLLDLVTNWQLNFFAYSNFLQLICRFTSNLNYNNQMQCHKTYYGLVLIGP